MLAVLTLSFTVASCNGSGDKKETTDSTTMKSDSMSAMPPVDTTKMMDTTKMDTAKPKPVKPGE
ncbi:MAG TPA: hypothetical protein VKC90_07980 [Chitinophagaceae bacterium]|nr:hypothetical protein [Chitinophagaceae bacterium]